METLDPTVQLILEGILRQAPAMLVAAAMIACVGWLIRTVRARRARRSRDSERAGRPTMPARGGADGT